MPSSLRSLRCCEVRTRTTSTLSNGDSVGTTHHSCAAEAPRTCVICHCVPNLIFSALTDTDAPHGLMLATESLVKVAECKLASNQFTACTHICSSLLSRRHCIPPIRTRVLLVRALALAGLHLFDNALADLQRCSQLSPADKQHALHCLVQRIQYHKRLQEAAEDSACSSSTRLASDDDCSSCSQA